MAKKSVPVQFGYEEPYRQTGFGQLYMTPEAKKLFEQECGEFIKQCRKSVANVVIYLENDGRFNVTTIPKIPSETKFYVELVNNPQLKFSSPDVIEKFEREHGPIRNYPSMDEILARVSEDGSYRTTRRKEVVMIGLNNGHKQKDEDLENRV